MPRRRKPRTETGLDQISPDEIVAFADFLDREPLVKRSMSIPMLDGFLTAIVIGPEMVMPSEYLPWIWDYKRGKKDAEFADLDEANRILGYVQGMHNRIAAPLMADSPAVVPIFMLDTELDHIDWVAGFVMGAEFDGEIWDYARKDAPHLFEPLTTLTAMEHHDPGRAEASVALAVSLVHIRDYFRAGEWRQAFEEVQTPVVRKGPKVGRNDPCPCGSGRKFKKCCGDAGGVVH